MGVFLSRGRFEDVDDVESDGVSCGTEPDILVLTGEFVELVGLVEFAGECPTFAVDVICDWGYAEFIQPFQAVECDMIQEFFGEVNVSWLWEYELVDYEAKFDGQSHNSLNLGSSSSPWGSTIDSSRRWSAAMSPWLTTRCGSTEFMVARRFSMAMTSFCFLKRVSKDRTSLMVVNNRKLFHCFCSCTFFSLLLVADAPKGMPGTAAAVYEGHRERRVNSIGEDAECLCIESTRREIQSKSQIECVLAKTSGSEEP